MNILSASSARQITENSIDKNIELEKFLEKISMHIQEYAKKGCLDCDYLLNEEEAMYKYDIILELENNGYTVVYNDTSLNIDWEE